MALTHRLLTVDDVPAVAARFPVWLADDVRVNAAPVHTCGAYHNSQTGRDPASGLTSTAHLTSWIKVGKGRVVIAVYDGRDLVAVAMVQPDGVLRRMNYDPTRPTDAMRGMYDAVLAVTGRRAAGLIDAPAARAAAEAMKQDPGRDPVVLDPTDRDRRESTDDRRVVG